MIVFEPSLEERLLIEAGAGTGKTWTIAGLYVRFIVEKQFLVNQILVVTFTNAATAELRERLRAKLVTAKLLLESGRYEDVFEQTLLENCSDKPAAIKRLTLAIRSFDEAAIYTIHGFCQKLLRETALLSGIGFNSELVGDDAEIIQLIVDDYWRKKTYACSEEWMAVVSVQKITPESLSQDIRNWIGKPWLEIYPQEPLNCQDCLQDLIEEKNQLQTLFDREKENIKQLFVDALGSTLKKNIYRPATFWQDFSELEAFLSSNDVLALPTKAALFTDEKLDSGKTKGQQPPEHAFFQRWQGFCEAHAQFKVWLKQQHGAMRTELLEHTRVELKKRKAADSILGYDDLLLLLNDALLSKEGDALAKTIRSQYPVALIDEFQDTDALQYNIFNRIYAGQKDPLIFVGDPKQAIYSFRGADIQTYLKAKSQVDEPLSLEENFRSSEDFIDAVNTLFSRHSNPFRESKIGYQAVKAGRGKAQQEAAPKVLGALRIWNDFSGTKPIPKKNIESRIVNAVADEIASLLNHADDADHQVAGRPLQGGDIAVLVRKNKQGQLIKAALNERQIGCVQHMQDNVFSSVEAVDLAAVLHAVTAAARDNDYRAALATVLLGLSAKSIADLRENGAAWEDWIDRFYRWRSIWQAQGFIVMIRTLLIEQKCYARLLHTSGGERRLTNFLHLCELIHHQAANGSLTPESLLLWFNRQRQQGRDSDEAQLRLESEDNLVKIATVHKSKGLQYGIVYCPFLWDDAPDSSPSNKPGKPFSFHDPEQPEKSWLVMKAEDDKPLKDHLIEETFSESLRLLYVALTRAEYHCTLVTGNFNLTHKSALSWLLFGTEIVKTSWKQDSETIRSLTTDERQSRLNALAEQSNDSIYLEPLPDADEMMLAIVQAQPHSGKPRSFDRRFPAAKKITSYSSLTRGYSFDLPDHDRFSQVIEPAEKAAGVELIRGREAGICLHWILERLDFAKPVAEQQSLIEDGLAMQGFTQVDVEAITRWLQTVLKTDLDAAQTVCLADIKNQQRMDELEFHFPLAQLNQRKLKAILKQYLKQPVIQIAIDRLSISSVGGYLKGFIDLIFCHQGRYFLVDYKSNWLGAEISAYDKQTLTGEIANAHYYLQYLIYIVALHRYLKIRLKDYQYERHIAGVYYLFIRGMSEETGSSYGVFHDLPDPALIESLSHLFDQGT